MKFFYIKINIALILFLIFSPLSASGSKEEKNQDQYKFQRYEALKREQKKEYKKGAHNKTNKDYVNDWIGKDINYQKRVIKLKREYREWVMDKISKKQRVRFKDYEPLKSMTRVEKRILYDYHNMLFKKKKQQNFRKHSRINEKKKTVVEKYVENHGNNEINIKNISLVPEEEPVKENSDIKYIFYILISSAGILIIASIIVYIKKFKMK